MKSTEGEINVATDGNMRAQKKKKENEQQKLCVINNEIPSLNLNAVK